MFKDGTDGTAFEKRLDSSLPIFPDAYRVDEQTLIAINKGSCKKHPGRRFKSDAMLTHAPYIRGPLGVGKED